MDVPRSLPRVRPSSIAVGRGIESQTQPVRGDRPGKHPLVRHPAGGAIKIAPIPLSCAASRMNLVKRPSVPWRASSATCAPA